MSHLSESLPTAHRQAETRPELLVALLDGGDGLLIGVQLGQVLLALGTKKSSWRRPWEEQKGENKEQQQGARKG